MKNLSFSTFLLLRRPAKPAARHLRSPQQFLNDPEFCAGLFLASPGFYHQIRQLGFLETALNEKQKTTLLKYINRTCFRPTPFGLFSSVSICKWDSKSISYAGEEKPAIVVRADELFTANFSCEINDQVPVCQASCVSNPSIYRAGEEYRFIRTGLDETGRTRTYTLQSIAYSKLLKELISFCKIKQPSSNLVGFIREVAACTLDEARDYFAFLMDAQLILSNNRLNITGPVNLPEVTVLADKNSQQTIEELRAVLACMEKPLADPAYFEKISSGLQNLLAPAKDLGNDSLLNVILYHRQGFTLDSKYQEWIAEGLYALGILCPQDIPDPLKKFIKAFTTYFDGQSVPLLKIIDPEFGIGYQQQESDTGNVLLETLHIEQNINTELTLGWSAAHAYLLRAWHSAAAAGRTIIRIQETDLPAIAKEFPQPLSPGISVLFRTCKDGIFIESAGGNNPVALMGRFTLGDEATRVAAQEIASRQETLNPDILFAEILHLSDPHIDNVNRRDRLWSWEIPLTAGPTPGFNGQLELSDLYVSVEHGKVMLRSQKHGRIVVPRLSSAYNHSVNKLPLFRFLADIPYQYGQYDLTLDLRRYFPGQSFYPRVIYKNAVIYPATWILSEEETGAASCCTRK